MSGGETTQYSDLSVLVVEDNEVNQKVTSAMLGYFGIAPDLAENGQIAIELAQNNEYDLILMDCQMPVKNGFETTQYIRGLSRVAEENYKTAPDVVIVAMSANASRADMDACMNCGMSDFIAKPVELMVISKMLEKWFVRKA